VKSMLVVINAGLKFSGYASQLFYTGAGEDPEIGFGGHL